MRLDYQIGSKFIKVIEETHADIFPAKEVSSRDNFLAYPCMCLALTEKREELIKAGTPFVLASISSKFETSIEAGEYGPKRVFAIYWPAQGK